VTLGDRNSRSAHSRDNLTSDPEFERAEHRGPPVQVQGDATPSKRCEWVRIEDA
jgi:hypothetical protein